MNPLKLLEQAYNLLSEYRNNYALAGGLAASFYRERPRLTNDVDIAFCVTDKEATVQAAKSIIAALGFDASWGWIDGLSEKTGEPMGLVIGREQGNELGSSIDFIIPTLPWVRKAVERGQDNLIDFGFARIPTLTPEDLVIAKVFALSLAPNRFQDLDDLISIFKTDNRLDLVYLTAELKSINLALPQTVASFAPAALQHL